jgi:type II secretory pathway pseudopilin PulG
MAPRSPGRLRQGGFTYLGLIILVTVLGMVGAATLKIDALLRRAAAEEELLDIGAAFSAALDSYAAATPRGLPPLPPSLQELLKDPRTPGLRRHLRKIFVDPVTGGTEWGIVYQADRVGVLGVYSLSQARPLKIGNFDPRFSGFGNKDHLSDWKFTASAMAAPLLTPAPMPAPPQERAMAAPVAAPAAEQPQLREVTPPPQEPAADPEENPEDKPVDTSGRKPPDQNKDS